ncbi:MAG: glycosyl hydrolase [Bacteroidota bacterium]
MKYSASLFFLSLILFLGIGCSEEDQLAQQFKNPPEAYKPMPFWHINGHLTREGIRQQMKDAKELAGFSGVSLLPLATYERNKYGTTPAFLSEEYFDRYADLIEVAEELDMEIILYDDNDFPSGMAGGKIEENHPEHSMKRLDKLGKTLFGPTIYEDTIPDGQLMAAVAMNTETLERIDLSEQIEDDKIRWKVPNGEWKVMFFRLALYGSHKAWLVVDFMDTVGVKHIIDYTYEAYAERYQQHFGDHIKIAFFDDVGFWRFPKAWTPTFNQKFEELNGFKPETYYPALWYDIGEETAAVRNAFFNTRAELLAEGYPRLAAAWADRYGLKTTGHPPGNYDPTPIDMNGDIFKFYRYTHIPLLDVIKNREFGRNGFKLISSAADYYDRPIVSTEIYGAFREHLFDSLELYRAQLESFARGVNFVIPHGLWYDTAHVKIPPLVSPYSEKVGTALPDYSQLVGRSCLMLQGGSRVADIGVLYPFEELAGWFRFDDPDNPRQGFFVSPETDYQEVSNLLTNEIRRDFTFIHPEFLLEDKYEIDEGNLYLNNQENKQTYRALIVTGCHTIRAKTLEKIYQFYESGGIVIATTQLPYQSAERGANEKVQQLIQQLFGVFPSKQKQTISLMNENAKGGKAIFIPELTEATLNQVLEDHLPTSDVQFSPNPNISNETGVFNYVHKVKDGQDIYFFSNSSDDKIDTEVWLRGDLKLEAWNPHTGEMQSLAVEKGTKKEVTYTKVSLTLSPIQSVFWVGK